MVENEKKGKELFRKIQDYVILAIVAAIMIPFMNDGFASQKVMAAIQNDQAVSARISPEYDIDVLAASVVRLEVFNSYGDRIGTGSGFAAFDKRLLVTAEHVVVNMDHMIATRDDGSTFEIDRIIMTDEASDVAICALPENAGLEPLLTETELPKRGSKVMVISSQFGITNLVTTGDVCGIWETEDNDWILFTAPVSGGSSGGPVFDEAGHVIGIVTGTYEKGQNLNIAASAEVVKHLCNYITE